ncbi:hypothetical protein FBR02_08505 [Anaerolineae bacterium CFX9]|nr:hypothetical protein [Anaerolineae bacterium CFX9]
MTGRLVRLLLGCVMLLATAAVSLAQPETPRLNHPRQVFVELDSADGSDRLIFLDMITGASNSVAVNGERFTLLENGVMFYDPSARRVRIAAADGSVNDHPFIQPAEGARRIDWLVSPDRQAVAWTITRGTPTALRTSTYIARISGDGTRLVLEDGPHDGIRAFPVAFNTEKTVLYMDYQPDTIADFTPFRQYAALFSLDLTTLDTRSLPGEAGCFCGAALGGGRFLRLALPREGAGFDLRVIDLGTLAQQVIRPLALQNPDYGEYTQSGDMLLSPDGTRAVYALARIRGFGSPEGLFETIFVMVDLISMRQTPITEPTVQMLHPVAWTEDSGAILFTSLRESGTWKVNAEGGSLQQIAAASYLGTLLPERED